MNKDSLTRRHFLQTSGIATGAILGLSILDPPLARAAGPFVRTDVGTLSATDPILTSYAAAITAMQQLDMTDPTNPLGWQYQAAIHGTMSPSTTPGEVATWNTCEHGTQYFLSWHRMYLYYFERIVRKMSGNTNWALPYWNYEAATEAAMPAPFWTPAAASNALYTANRGTGWNTGKTTLHPSAVSTMTAFADVDFGSFWSDLETTPHDAVHNAIGGLMGNIQTSAQDPIFFLHHCNIDRLWNLWLTQGGRFDPLSNSAADKQWQNNKFTFFDENKNQVTLTGCDILRAQEQLGYKYDTEPPQVLQFCKAEFHIPIVYYIPWFLCWPGPVTVPPLIGPTEFTASTEQLAQHVASTPISSLKAGSNIVLKLTEVQADHQPNVFYEVYVGLPKGAATTIKSPFYVGNLALFGRGIRDMKQHGHAADQSNGANAQGAPFASFTFKVTRAVGAVMKETKAPKTLSILMVPRGALIDGRPDERKPTATIHIGRAEIGLERLE